MFKKLLDIKHEVKKILVQICKNIKHLSFDGEGVELPPREHAHDFRTRNTRSIFVRDVCVRLFVLTFCLNNIRFL